MTFKREVIICSAEGGVAAKTKAEVLAIEAKMLNGMPIFLIAFAFFSKSFFNEDNMALPPFLKE